MLRCYRLEGAAAHAMDTGEAESLDALSRQLPQGVYTTFRTYHRSKALHLPGHLDRLVESAALLGQRLSLDRHAVRAALASALAAWPEPEARVRLTLSFDPSGVVYLALGRLVELPPGAYEHGVACTTAPASDLRRETPRAKTTSFIVPGAQARGSAAGVEEVLLLSPHGLILEGSSSNVYAVLDGALRTADEGVLAGITRGIVLAEAEGLLPIVLHPVALADLPHLQEAFITSVSRGVLPVTSIDGRPVGDGVPGPVTRELGRRFAARIEREIEEI